MNGATAEPWESTINHRNVSPNDAMVVGDAEVGLVPWGIVVSPDGNQVYVANILKYYAAYRLIDKRSRERARVKSGT